MDPEFENLVSVRFGSELVNLDRNNTPMKLSSPEPDRSLRNIFRPGQWVGHDAFGTGMIISVSDVILTIRFDAAIKRIAPTRTNFYVSPLPVPDQDMETAVEGKRTFFDINPTHNDGMKSCLCCGYPTVKEPVTGLFDDYMGPDEPCVVCGWTYDHRENPTPPEMEEVFEGFAEDYPNGDYPLSESRTNFEAHGTMYRPEDSDHFEKSTRHTRTMLRKEITALFDSLMEKSVDAEIKDIWSSIREKLTTLKKEQE